MAKANLRHFTQLKGSVGVWQVSRAGFASQHNNDRTDNLSEIAGIVNREINREELLFLFKDFFETLGARNKPQLMGTVVVVFLAGSDFYAA